MPTRLLSPRVTESSWRTALGDEHVIVIRTGDRVIRISPAHAREVADRLHDIADNHESAERNMRA
ncbi:MAG: hypothetical protein ACTH31_09975 [Pseudoclavibacter sp.]